MVADGGGVTVTTTFALAVQPFASVTVTVKVAFAWGLTVIFWLVAPVDHLYPLYGDNVESVVGFPLQTGLVVALVAGVGNAFTRTVATAAEVHPLLSVTVTV